MQITKKKGGGNEKDSIPFVPLFSQVRYRSLTSPSRLAASATHPPRLHLLLLRPELSISLRLFTRVRTRCSMFFIFYFFFTFFESGRLIDVI